MKQKKCSILTRSRNLLYLDCNGEKKICFLVWRKLQHELMRLIVEEGMTYFLCDMKRGMGLSAAELLLRLRDKYPQITVECVIPFEEYAGGWAEPHRDRYFDIVARCDKETLLQTRYTPDCMQKQQQYMVDAADCVLIHWNPNRALQR